jgi:hypothetical protein
MESARHFYLFVLTHNLIRKMGPFFKDHAIGASPDLLTSAVIAVTRRIAGAAPSRNHDFCLMALRFVNQKFDKWQRGGD